MASRTNDVGQPIGQELPGWAACPFPDVTSMVGQWCRVEPMLAEHADELYGELCGPDNADLWTYLSVGPFADPAEFAEMVEAWAESRDSVSVVIRGADGVACGLAHLMNIRPAQGVLEVGGVALGRRLQRTTAATEAQFLLARHVFALGYRRYEWKCDALNEPSRRAAQRLGFTHEGRFRQALVYKGRNRDTDWFSIIDGEWPALESSYDVWLAPDNQVGGKQVRSLGDVRATG